MHFTADHAQQATDVQTWYYFRRRVKRFIRGIIWPGADEEQNGPGLWEFPGEKRQLSLPATSTHTREL